MKKEMPKTGTVSEAMRLLRQSGQDAPPPERIELTRFLMQTCKEIGWKFTTWDESLYPALDSFGDVELITEIEAAFGVVLDEAEMMAAPLDTFGDLVTYLEPRLLPALSALPHGGKTGEIAAASCATQAAFYAVRHTLCEAGASFPAVHVLRPSASVGRLSNKQAEYLVREMNKNYGVDVPLRRVVWGWLEVKPLTLLVLFFIMLVCVVLSDYLPGRMASAVTLLVSASALTGWRLLRCGRSKWPKEYQTLGDIARKIADTAATPATTQPAHL